MTCGKISKLVFSNCRFGLRFVFHLTRRWGLAVWRLESTVETQPQFQPASLFLSAMMSQYLQDRPHTVAIALNQMELFKFLLRLFDSPRNSHQRFDVHLAFVLRVGVTECVEVDELPVVFNEMFGEQWRPKFALKF